MTKVLFAAILLLSVQASAVEYAGYAKVAGALPSECTPDPRQRIMCA